MNEIRIPYKPRKIIFFAGVIFFGACAGFLGHLAITNTKGLIINGIIELSVENATIFYWTVSTVSMVFVIAAVLALLLSFVSNREIIISNDSITSPKSGFSKLNVTIQFSEISNVFVQSIQKTEILTIEHNNDKLSIPNNMVPQKEDFEMLINHLQEKMKR